MCPLGWGLKTSSLSPYGVLIFCCVNRVLDRTPEVVECLDPMEQNKKKIVEKLKSPAVFELKNGEEYTHSLGATGGNPIECLVLEGPYTQCVYKWVDTIHLDNRLDMMRLVTVFKRLPSVSLNEAVHHFGQNKTQYPP